MSVRRPVVPVKLGFEEVSLRIPINAIMLLREITDAVRKSIKYNQIAASIIEIGIIEPPVVVRDAADREKYHLLDGHIRIDALRSQGETEVVCLVATDDEAFTYNKRVSRIAIIQEHRMILNAIRKGVSEERLARALNVDIVSIRKKRNLLIGICPEVANLLRDRHVPIHVFTELRRLTPLRQIDVAQAMITMNRFSLSYAKSLVASTRDEQLVVKRLHRPRALTAEQITLMQRETENLDREFRVVEQSYSEDHLDMVLAIGYITSLLKNARVVRYLAQHHAPIFAEFQKIAQLDLAA